MGFLNTATPQQARRLVRAGLAKGVATSPSFVAQVKSGDLRVARPRPLEIAKFLHALSP